MPLKNKILTLVMLIASGFFLYQGFSMLFHPQEEGTKVKLELKEVSHP